MDGQYYASSGHFLAGLVVSLVYFRKRFPLILLCGLPVMVLPDMVAGDRDWPHETRIVGVFPIVAALAGRGIGGVLDWLSPWRNLKLATGWLLAAAGGFTTHAQVADLIVSDGQSYLLPLSNYADSVIKYLTSRRAL